MSHEVDVGYQVEEAPVIFDSIDPVLPLLLVGDDLLSDALLDQFSEPLPPLTDLELIILLPLLLVFGFLLVYDIDEGSTIRVTSGSALR